MSGYAAGVRTEHAVIHELTRDGYECTRAASSKGSGDVIAIKEGQVVLVSCKRSRWPGPDERAALVRIAAMIGLGIGVPVVAVGPPSAVVYWRLTGTGRRDCEPWHPDEIAW